MDCGIVVGIINNDDDKQCRKDRKSNNESQCVIAETLTVDRSYYVDTMLKCTGCFYYSSIWNSIKEPMGLWLKKSRKLI